MFDYSSENAPLFDLKLFRELNEEYLTKPLVPRPPRYDAKTLKERGPVRVDKVLKLLPLEQGKRIVEIGCGRGETSRAFAEQCGCEAIGIDIKQYDQWAGHANVDRLRLIQADLSQGVPEDLRAFDFAYSNAVWEHVRHPFAMLKAVHAMLKEGGQFYFVANLFRGPKASHRYREVFFPWPHLLFTDAVFEEFYRSIGKSPRRAAWVNQLSIGDYFRYFDMVGFKPEKVWYNTTPIDEPFYQRFSDVLERFPRYDLERDFIHAVLVKGDPVTS